MLNKIAKLIDVKTIVTFIVFGVFAYLAIKGIIETKDVMIAVIMVATYFFNKPSKKDSDT